MFTSVTILVHIMYYYYNITEYILTKLKKCINKDFNKLL